MPKQVVRHDRCGKVSVLDSQIAENTDINPKFYSTLDCPVCQGSFPIGGFSWVPDGKRVGS